MLCEDLYYLLRVYRYKSSTKPGRAKQALREHKDIVAALMKRDPVEAERKMRLHIGNARLYVEEQMREAASRQEVAPGCGGAEAEDDDHFVRQGRQGCCSGAKVVPR